MRLTRRGDGSRYDQVTAGFKANLSDVLAAIALVQLDKLEAHGEIRRGSSRSTTRVSPTSTGSTPLARDARDTHALHLYVVRIDPSARGATRDEYQRALAEERIATSIHFLPVHRLTWFRERYPDQPRLPVAERAGDEVLSLPLSPAHSDEDILGRDRRGPPGARPPGRMKRSTRIGLTLLLTGLALAYLVWKVDLGTTIDILLDATSVVVRARGRDHDRHRPADGRPVAVAAARAGDRRPAALAHPHVLHVVHGRPGAADRDRRRRVAGLETSRRHPGRTGDITAIVLLERALGGVGDARARGDRLPARGRALRRRRLPLDRGRVRRRHDRARVPLLRALGAAAPRALRPAADRSRVERPMRALYDGVHHYRGHRGCSPGSSRTRR